MTGHELRAIRKQLGLTLAGMAQRMSIHWNHLAQMERGEKLITDERAWQARALNDESKTMTSTGQHLRTRLYGQKFASLAEARKMAGISTMDVFTSACRANDITFTGFSTGLQFHDRVTVSDGLRVAMEREIPGHLLADNQISVRPPLDDDREQFPGASRGDVIATHAVGVTLWGEWLFTREPALGWICADRWGEARDWRSNSHG